MKKVALLVETSNAYARGLLRGIVSYNHEHRPWSLYFAERGRGEKPPDWLVQWEGDGIIARIETPATADALRQVKIPVVDMSAARLVPRLPWFETDDPAIAQLAFEHLHERGFRRFAYCGDPRFNWSNWRGEHFEKAARAERAPCFIYQPARHFEPDEPERFADICHWIQKLPKPVGIMACYDYRGQEILDACRQLGFTVPHQVGVIGVDNDELLCELCHPPMSSVIPNAHRTGYEAAVLLDKMMAGERVGGETHLIPPLGIATRQSTDVLAVKDRYVARAVRYIREHAPGGITVADVVRAVPQARRSLERRFKQVLGHTPHEEILRVQLDHVAALLTRTDLSLSDIAERCGFAHAEYLSVVFKKKFGVPPSQYRWKSQQ